MKKSNMLIAVFAVVTATASFAGAEGFGVDFDRGAFRTADFMEAVKTSDVFKADKGDNIPPVPVIAATILSMKVYKLSVPGLQKLRNEILNMPGLSKEFLQLISEEKMVVLYNRDNVFLTTLVGDTRYIIFESNDRGLIDFLVKEKMRLPQEEFRNKAAGLVWTCATKIETIMKWINYAWVAVQVAREVCSWQNSGTSPSTGNPGGSGGTYHNGQGGSSNYDVNKQLK